MKKVLLALLLSIASTSFAALPPLAQNIRELKQILDSEELIQNLHSGESIQDIRKNEAGYLIETNQQLLQIDVLYNKKIHKIGPVEFSLQFNPPIQKNHG